MTVSNSLLSYQDCFELLDRAIEDKVGARYQVRDHDAAINLRSRIHYARKLDRNKNAQIFDAGHPMHGCSQYDALTVRIRFVSEDCYVYLERTDRVQGEIEALSEVPEPPLMEAPRPVLRIEHQPAEPVKRRV